MTEEKLCSDTGCGRSSCEGCPSAEREQQQHDFAARLNPLSTVKRVIGIVSGKGGVGKSLLTGLLACALARRGQKTAVLDADITGPSIGHLFSVHGKVQGNELGVFPFVSKSGIQVITANMFLPAPAEPVIWRGPLLADMVKQFYSDVIWTDVDFMLVDLPPGTGDVPLTVFQSLPLDGIVVITSPQELVSMIVGKAVKMAQMMKVPIIGLVENYSYFLCPDNGKRYELFGPSHLEETAAAYGLKVLARLPIEPALAAACDAGKIEEVRSAAVEACLDALLETLPEQKG